MMCFHAISDSKTLGLCACVINRPRVCPQLILNTTGLISLIFEHIRDCTVLVRIAYMFYYKPSGVTFYI